MKHATQPSVSYIPFATSFHVKTGNIITFAQFEEANLLENERNIVEHVSILVSIDQSYADDNSD